MKKLFIEFPTSQPVLNEILKEYGLSPEKIKRIKSRYPDVKSILDASPQEISQIVDIDVDEAKKLQIFIKKKVSTNKVGSDFLKRWGRVSSDSNLKNSYEEYDRLSKLYPNSPIVWEIKGEILEKMGRFKEAIDSYKKAYNLYLQRGEMPPEELTERVRKRKNITVPSTKVGLSNGLGNINGFKNGFKNGLINGSGISRKDYISSTNMRSIGKIIIPLFILFLIISAPLLGMIFFEKHYIFKVDGDFQEWESEISYYGLKSFNSPVNILNAKFHPADNGIYFYVQPTKDIFEKPGGIYIFIDTDISNHTGYIVDNLGADYMVEIYGWNSTLKGENLYIFNGSNQQDFSNFKRLRGINVIYKNQKLEGFLSIPYKKFRAMTIYYDYMGNEAIAPCPLYGKNAFLVIEEKYSSLLKINKEDAILKITFIGKEISINSISFVHSGTATPYPYYNFSFYADNGDGVFDSHDSWLSSTLLRGDILIFENLNINTGNSTFFLTVKLNDYRNVGKTIKMEIQNINSTQEYFIDNRIEDSTYIEEIPSKPVIDGSFDDWKNVSLDNPYDVVSSNGKIGIDSPNIDLLHFSLYKEETLYVFMDVRGKILGGTDIPTIRFPTLRDSDGDSVPDIFDPYPYDFNNDGVPDNESYVIVNGEKLPDVDGDEEADYPQGNDMWLNTTLPSWFPEPYANREIHKYIGPVPKKEVYGMDTLTVYIDSDNRTSTGFSLPQYPIGAEYKVEIYGRDGKVLNSSLYKFDRGWHYMGNVSYFIGYHGLEMNTGVSGKNMIVLISDWHENRDVSDEVVHTRSFPLSFEKISNSNGSIAEKMKTINPEYIGTYNSLRALFESDVLVSDISNSNRRDENHPSIVQESDGTLWVTWSFERRNGKHDIAIAYSTDDGENWNGWRLYNNRDYDTSNPVMVINPLNDEIYLFFENHTSNAYFQFFKYSPSSDQWSVYSISSFNWENIYNLSAVSHSESSGLDIYLSFEYHNSSSNSTVGYLYTLDGGNTWSSPLVVSLPYWIGHPSITISTGSEPKVFLSFDLNYNSGDYWVLFIANNSAIGNNNWTARYFYGNTSNNYLSYMYPSIYASGDKIYVAFQADYGYYFLWWWIHIDWDIGFLRSLDNGATWEDPTIVVSSGDDEIYPIAAANGKSIYIFYLNSSSGYIYMIESKDRGDTWSRAYLVSDKSTGVAMYHTLSAIYSNGKIYVVWTDERNRSDDIYFDKIPEFSDLLWIMIPLLILIPTLKRKRSLKQ